MAPPRFPVVDQTLALALEGYGWLSNRRRRSAGDLVRTRVMGQRAVGLCGPDAARFFYDEEHVRRHTAVPEPAQGTLFGRHGVQTLDGEQHRRRKALFMSLMTPQHVSALVEHATAAWDERVASWPDRKPVVLFDEASRAITAGVCRWTGVPVDGTEVGPLAADLVAMVDGFAAAGPRHWRARRARGRLEAHLAGLVQDARRGAVAATPGSALDAVASHRDIDGQLLDARLAAVELLNVVRPHTGHRCPGEAITVALLQALTVRLARLHYEVPTQDVGISLRRIPARVASGFVLTPTHRHRAQPQHPTIRPAARRG